MLYIGKIISTSTPKITIKITIKKRGKRAHLLRLGQVLGVGESDGGIFSHQVQPLVGPVLALRPAQGFR